MNQLHKDILEKAGLAENEISIYTILLNDGEMPAKELKEKSGLKHGIAYYVMDKLQEHGLIEKVKQGRTSIYRATHPLNLRNFMHGKQEELNETTREVDALIPNLASQFVLNSSQPGIEMFEGEEGFRRALFHSLETENEILTFSNSQVAETMAGDLESEYIAARKRKKIKKRMILEDSAESRAFQKEHTNEYTQVKLLDEKKYPVSLGVEIYDETVTFLTAKNGNLVAFSLQHPDVAEYHRSVFEFFWNQLD